VRRVTSIDSLYDFIGYVVLCAPDNFPAEAYLPPEDQMSLEKAFGELRDAVQLIDSEVASDEKRERIYALLDQALAAYRNHDDFRGAHLLQDFQDAIFEPPDVRRG
jgi:hypothetical protein